MLAVENNIKSTAFPAISCGVYGYPIDDACKIAVDTTGQFLENNASIEKVIFILFSAGDKVVYNAYLMSLG